MSEGQSPGQRIKAARKAKKMTQKELGEACGWDDAQGRVGNYERDEREPGKAEWEAMGRALDVDPGYLQFGRQVRMPLSDYNVESAPMARRMAPLISWVQAGNWAGIEDPYRVGDAEDWLPAPRGAGPRVFALRVRGASMEPKYLHGDVIFVDPDAEPRHGSRVIVRLENENEATFKELVVEGDRRYLRPLNPSWPGQQIIEITSDAVICGVVMKGKWVEE